jgi:ferritin-like metal-binding protein YciE
LYERWASGIGNAEAASLFRQNGKEESDHGNRLLEAAALLAG